MLGQIETIDNESQTATINSEDGQYTFELREWQAEQPPKKGDQVDFELEEEKASNVSLASPFIKDMQPVKSRILAGLLGIVLGAVGMHRFYLGHYGYGIAQTIVTVATGGFGVMWGFIEGVLIITGHINKDAKGRYLK